MPKIAHISDFHLQSGVPERQAQVEPILKKINEMKPDLVVISGDVTDDGYKSLDELKWAKDWLDERIEGEWFAVPGNHDVGNFASLGKGVINHERVQNWHNVFGANASVTIGRWLLLGLNSMYHGSGLSAQIDQDAWFASEIKKKKDRHLAVFLHSPLFVERILEDDDPNAGYWLGPGNDRRYLWKQFAMWARVIGSGHVHQTRLTDADGVKIAWAPPASGTWVHAPGLPNPPMPEKTGFFLHHLHDDGRVDSELIECAPMLKLYEHNPWP